MNLALKILVGLFFLLLAAASWYYLSSIISYIIVAGVLSLIGRPVMSAFQNLSIGKIKIPNSIAAILTLASFYLVIGALIMLFAPMIVQQVSLLRDLDYNSILTSLEQPIAHANTFLHKYGVIPPNELLEDKIQEGMTTYLGSLNITSIFGSVFGVIGDVFGILIATFAITFITFFFLTDRALLYNLVFSLVPPKIEGGFDGVVHQSKELLTRYFIGIVVQFIAVSIYITLGMLFLGVENALLIGFFGGIMNIIPYVGPILGLAFGIFVGVTTNLGMDFYIEMLPLLVKISIVFGSMQLLDNMFLQPMIFSNSVKAHPLEIFLLILVAGTLSGITGMILAIPLYTIFRVIAKEFLSEFKIFQRLSRNL